MNVCKEIAGFAQKVKRKCPIWRFVVSAEKFLSLFLAPEIGWLLLILGVIIIISDVVHHGLWEGFCSLFSLNHDITDGKARFVSGLLFFIVWLIGGGVLVSVLVSQRRRRDNGEFRLFSGRMFSWRILSLLRKSVSWSRSWLLKEHIVILGWDDNVPSIIKKELRKDPLRKFVIVTMSKVDYVLKAIASADIDRWHVLLYRGLYDDDTERDNSVVEQASAIYVIGEAREESHDARVFLLARKVQAYIKDRNISVFANIVDFGLANKLRTDVGEKLLCEVKCINFHLYSVENMLRKAQSPEKPFTHVAIIGFGAMGKAVAVKILGDALGTPPFVVATDDDEAKLTMEKNRFDVQFPMYKSIARTMPYNVFLESLGTERSNENWLIVIAKHRSEKGLGIVWDVLSATKGHANVKIVLNQEVKCDLWMGAEQNSMEIEGREIGLFGFKRGDIDGD